jgi:hypothetical protein
MTCNSVSLFSAGDEVNRYGAAGNTLLRRQKERRVACLEVFERDEGGAEQPAMNRDLRVFAYGKPRGVKP